MYKDLEAQLHDLFWASESDADESSLLESFLTSHPGKSLEIGCGSGRLLIPLFEKGFDIEGVEVSSDMVKLLKAKAHAQQLSPRIHHLDVSQLSTATQYSAIVIPAFTLQLFSRPAALKLLSHLRSLVKPTAGLYITLFIPWSEILDELEQDVWHPDKEATLLDGATAHCETRHAINRVSQTLSRDHHYTLRDTSGAKVKDQLVHQELQWYLLPELVLMLRQCGWDLATHHADFSIGNKDTDASVLTLFASAV